MIYYLYAIGNNTNRQKIGFSKNPQKRLIELQTGNSDQLYLHHKIECDADNIRKLEKRVHQELSYKKLKGEWFNMTAKEASDYIEYAKITWADKSF